MSLNASHFGSRPLPARRKVILAAILIAVAIAFLPALENGFISDDFGLIVRRISTLESPRGLGQLVGNVYWWGTGQIEARHDLYRPFVSATFWIEYQLGGDSPFVYHLSNYLVHLANTALVYLCLAPVAGGGLAVTVAALFGLSPMAVTSVGWISGRTDLWAAFFVLLFLWLFGLARRRRSNVFLIGACVSLFLALTAKEAAIIAPLIAWVLERSRTARELAGDRSDRPVGHYLLMIAPVAAYLIVRWIAVGVLLFRSPTGTGSLADPVPFLAERIVRTATNILAPIHYSFYSEFLWSATDARGVGFVLVWIVFLVLIALAVMGLIRRQLWAAGGLWFGAALLPVYLMGQSWAALSDFYAYLAIPGFWLFVTEGVRALAKTAIPRWKVPPIPVYVVIGGLAMVFGAATFVRLPILRSQFALAEHMVQREPSSLRAVMSMGEEYFAMRNASQGEEWMMRAAKIDPSSKDPWMKCAQFHIARGDLRSAASFVDTLAVLAPQSGDAQAVIARFYFEAGHCEESVEVFKRSLSLAYPTSVTLYDYGMALLCIGKDSVAADVYDLALQQRPFWPEAYANLGLAYENMGQLARAAEAYLKALEQDSRFAPAWESLAIVYLQMGRTGDARRAAQGYFSLDPPSERAERLRQALEQAEE